MEQRRAQTVQPTANNPQATIASQPIQSATPTPPELPPMPSAGGNHKMIVGVVIVLVIIILGVGGVYWYMNNKQSMKQAETNKQATVTPAPTPESQDNLEKDLNSIDAEASASGIDSVDSDLKGL